MFGNRHHISMRLSQDSVRGSALRALTLAIFQLGMMGQGFIPCPHHASLGTSGHAQRGVTTGAIPDGMSDGLANPAGPESEHDEALCTCLNACETESDDSFSPGQSHTRPPPFTALNVVERLRTSLLDARPNVYLVPLPQPPPHNA